MSGPARATPAASGGVDRRRHLEELLALLWPAPAVVSIGRGGPPGADLELVALPRLDDARLLVPRRPRRVASAAVRNYRASATGVARVKAEVAALVARVGGTDMSPARIAITRNDSDTIDRHLAQILGTDVQVCLYIGPARAVQKPVLQVLSTDGTTLAFAKIAVNALTRQLLGNEASTLRLLAAARLDDVRAPELLHTGTWRGHDVLVQRAIPRRGSGPVSAAALVAATREVAMCGGLEQQPLLSGGYWRQLTKRIGSLPTSPAATTLAEALPVIETRFGDATLAIGSWHGDWAPWNMTARGGCVVAWDWEHFETGVPVGFDAVHHRLQQLVVDDARTPGAAFDEIAASAARLVDGLPVHASDAGLVALLYAIEIATRYIEDDEVSLAETSLSRLDDWLADAIRTLLASGDDGASR